MNTNQPTSIVEAVNQPQPESHHGDLRKCAYLQRRAAYQLQASSDASKQAGTLPDYRVAMPGERRRD